MSTRERLFRSAVPGRLRALWTGSPNLVPGCAPPKQFLAAAILLALTLLTYLPLLAGGFLMDDLRLIHLENPLATGQLTPGNLWFQSDFPLSTLTLWVQWLAWGKHPAPYHALSIALHACSAVLLWRVLLRLRLRAAWLAAALFAVHPVCVHSVARIAELKNTLSLPFFLLSVSWYLSYEAAVLYSSQELQPGPRRRATVAYTCSLLAFVLALLSKTSTVMLPLVLLACAFWQRGKVTRRDVLHTGPHFLLALGFGMMSVWFQKYQALAGETLLATTFLDRCLLAARAVGFYLGKAFLPINLNLVYPRWTIDAHSLSAFLPPVLLALGLLCCWGFRRSWGRHALFALACFGITIFPGLGFVDAKFLTTWQVSDHLQYLPLMAAVALAAAALDYLRASLPVRLAPAVVVLAVCVLGFQRARVFSSEETLLRDTLARNPAATSAHNDLGVLLASRKDLSEALAQFTAAAQGNPTDPAIQSNLGQALAALGQPGPGEAHLRTALVLKPSDAEAHV